MKKLLLSVIIFASSLCAQRGIEVNLSQSPPISAYTKLFFYDGSNQLEYVCTALSQQPSFSWTRAASTLTSIVDAANTSTVTTSTAHGLAVGNLVTITGATVDTDLNGTYFIQTVGSTTTFTITTSGVSDATYTESTLVVATTAPRSSASMWDITKYIYAATLMSHAQHAGGKSATNSICDNRAVTTGSTKTTYQ